MMEIYSEHFIDEYIYETNKKHFRHIKDLKIEEFERMGINRSPVKNTNMYLLFVAHNDTHYPIGFFVEGVGNSYHIHKEFIRVVQSLSVYSFDRLIEHGIKISSGMISAFVSKTSTRTMIETTLSSLINTIENERIAKYYEEPSPFLDHIINVLQTCEIVSMISESEANDLYDSTFIHFKHTADNGRVAKIMFYTEYRKYFIGYRVGGFCFLRTDIASNETVFINGEVQASVIHRIILIRTSIDLYDMCSLQLMINQIIYKNDTPVEEKKLPVGEIELPCQETERPIEEITSILEELISRVNSDFPKSYKKKKTLSHLFQVESFLTDLED